jgi:GAF domain-containing protein
MVATRTARSFGADELALLATVADWTGLGLENAVRREAQPRASVAPPSGVAEVDVAIQEVRRTLRAPRG